MKVDDSLDQISTEEVTQGIILKIKQNSKNGCEVWKNIRSQEKF